MHPVSGHATTAALSGARITPSVDERRDRPTAELAALDERLFTWPSVEPRLIGSRCASCGTTTFPARASCPRCGSASVVEHLLARSGTLWSWTVQRFAPKAPPFILDTSEQANVPFGVGYVHLPADDVIVHTRLTTCDTSVLVTGLPVQLAIIELGVVPSRGPVVTFAFGPAQ